MKNDFKDDIRHPETNLKAAFDSMPFGLIITDARGVVTYFNKAQCEIDGIAREDAIGSHLTEIYVPSPESSPILLSMRLAQPMFDLFEVYETKNGRIVNSTHTVLPLSKDGRIRGCVCLVQPLSIDHESPKATPSAKETLLFGKLVGSSPAFLDSVKTALLAADSPSSVLIFGETGAGKELLARQLHEQSKRAPKPYMTINCSAIPANLLEGLLFGSVKGAFTGAVTGPGLFEEADGGTVYLDEVDSMPLELQPKLLRVIQERRLRRLGAVQEKEVDIKVISSFSVDPIEAVKAGRVRADLFYRLGVVIVRIPPLRERMSDLPSLVTFFINKHQVRLGKKANGLTPEVIQSFKAHNWPGNVRELENIIEGALNLIDDGETICSRHLPMHFQTKISGVGREKQADAAMEASSFGTVKSAPLRSTFPAEALFNKGFANGSSVGTPSKPTKIGRREIMDVMTQTRGALKEASEILGISRQLLAYRLKKYDLTRRQFDV
ncbi:MAG: sigma 54-interacting transcriptional regulator [Deltaproteobacteria bacterium]|nr:sigma 54-interacting transcriptional regulator [Deltaproteobacteria bacterium]